MATEATVARAAREATVAHLVRQLAATANSSHQDTELEPEQEPGLEPEPEPEGTQLAVTDQETELHRTEQAQTRAAPATRSSTCQ